MKFFKDILSITLLIIDLQIIIVHSFPSNYYDVNHEIFQHNYEQLFTKSDLPISDFIKPIKETYNTKCGIRNLNPDILSSRILDSNDDDDTVIGESPWQISLAIWKNKKYIFNGGGSIIHQSIVMTVAHRVQNIPLNNLLIRAGQWNLINNDEINERQDRNIKKIIIHENFERRTFINDIALLVLEKPLLFTSFVSPVCLPPVNMIFDHNLCTVYGWGKNEYGENGRYQEILKKVNIPIVPQNQCKKSYEMIGLNSLKLSSFVCAGGEYGKDSCTGDGGSPLVCSISNDSNQFYQIGIVATGVKCGITGIPGLYTNVSNLRSWIDEQVINEGFDISSYSYTL